MVTVPKWLSKPRKDNKRDEQDWSERRGGRTQPSSGRFWHAKYDVRDEELLSDCKETERLSFTIKKSDWKNLMRRAQQEGLEPCLKISFLEKGRDRIEIVVLPAHFFESSQNPGKP